MSGAARSAARTRAAAERGEALDLEEPDSAVLLGCLKDGCPRKPAGTGLAWFGQGPYVGTVDQVYAGSAWLDHGLVFCTSHGSELDAANVRRSFRAVAKAARLDSETWTPRELRHSFVSLLSSSGMPIEDIAHLVGHANTKTTEQVYRKELRPMLTKGARARMSSSATRPVDSGCQFGCEGRPRSRA